MTNRHATTLRRTLHLASAVATLLVAVALAGCGGKGDRGTLVTFSADPANATLLVERLARPDAPRGQVVARGASPLQTRLLLTSPQAAFRISAEPNSVEVRESHQTTEVRYDRDELLRAGGVLSAPSPTRAPDGRGSAGRLPASLRVPVPLRQRASVPMVTMLPVYHPRDGWLAVRTRLRADRNLIEADGAAPEQVVPLSALSAVGSPDRLGTSIGVWGLDISQADGGRIVLATFQPDDEGLALERDDPEAAPRVARLEPERRARARFNSDYRFPITSANIVSLRLTGLTEVRLTADGHADLTPAFTPDGQHVFFASDRDKPGRSDIFRRPALRAGALDVVTRNLPDGGAAWPSQASDGTIAFGFHPADATSPDSGQIYAKIGGLGGYDSLVVQGGGDPRLSRDGQQIAYVSRGDLWTCSTDGSQQRRLTSDAATLLESFSQSALPSDDDRRRFEQFEKQWLFPPYRDPSFSPDGRHLLYAALSGSDAEGRPNYDVWLLDLETNARTQVTTNASADMLPRFDPVGEFIYFLSNRGLQWSVWRLPTPPVAAAP